MKKIALIIVTISGIGLAAFKNSDKRIFPVKNYDTRVENPIGTQINYDVDVEKSSVCWHAKKVTGDHSGTIKIMKGAIYRNKGIFMSGEFEMDINSIRDTDITNPESKSKLEAILKSEKFFDAAKFPLASFKIKAWVPVKDAKPGAANYNIKGDLTIKGITKEIIFPAIADLNGKTVTASAEFNIDRTDFGLKYQSVKFDPGIGDKMIYDEFNVKINLIANTK